jgi:ribosome biogenesis GTPase A
MQQAFLIDTPGIMQPSLAPEDGLKLALTGAIKENIVDTITLADYLLFLLNRKGQVCSGPLFASGVSGRGKDGQNHPVS